jgi:hypothetical protein
MIECTRTRANLVDIPRDASGPIAQEDFQCQYKGCGAAAPLNK